MPEPDNLGGLFAILRQTNKLLNSLHADLEGAELKDFDRRLRRVERHQYLLVGILLALIAISNPALIKGVLALL